MSRYPHLQPLFPANFSLSNVHNHAASSQRTPAFSRAGVLFLILIAAALCLTGCGATPTAQWASARDGLTVGTNGLTTAARLGKLTDKQILAADAFVQAARAGIKNAEGYLPEGGPAFDSYLAAVDTLLVKLAEFATQTHKPPQE